MTKLNKTCRKQYPSHIQDHYVALFPGLPAAYHLYLTEAMVVSLE